MVFLDVGRPGPSVANIKVDYQMGIDKAVQHLLELGHTRVAFVSGPEHLKSARLRRSAFLYCMSEGGVVEDSRYIELGDHKIEGGLQSAGRLLQLEHRPTAVLASNDLTAIGALRGIRKAGLSGPRDISVIGFDDIDLASFTDPPLTTIRLSRTEIARCAFNALLSSIEGKGPGEEIVVETQLVIRESTAAAPSRS